MQQPVRRLWDIFCRVIDNYGDLGVCWRLTHQLLTRGQSVRLWVNDARALRWMAPQAHALPHLRVLPWPADFSTEQLTHLPCADVWVESFGCDLPAKFVAYYAAAIHDGVSLHRTPPCWINLEYLSAETRIENLHGLPSPVLHGPAAGWTKRFFYPGFTPRTGGLLREPDLIARQQKFDRPAWLKRHGVAWHGQHVISLFCYEPGPLRELLTQLAVSQTPSQLLVTAGRATQAVSVALGKQWAEHGSLRLTWLPHLSQQEYDHLLWASDLNFVRGEDSWVRAIWADRPFIWHIYPQHDNAHHAKLLAFLDRLNAPASLQAFHRVWNRLCDEPLPNIDISAWRACVQAAHQLLRRQPDLVTQLMQWTEGANDGKPDRAAPT